MTIPNIPPWNGEQSKDFSKVPWYFPSQEYNENYLNDIKNALENNISYSFIRIGDGEIAILQQEYVHTIDHLVRNIPWSSGVGYCGTKIPNLELRDRMIDGIKNSDLVGVFKSDPLHEEVFEKIGIQPKSICYAFCNVGLPMNPVFVQMLFDVPILLVGKNAKYYEEQLKEHLQLNIVGTVGINDYSEIDKCMDEMCKYEYKLALVSAGANAKVICPEMAQQKNAVYLDMGHAWDNAFHPLYKEYWLLRNWESNKEYVTSNLVFYNKIPYVCISNVTSNITPNLDTYHWGVRLI